MQRRWYWKAYLVLLAIMTVAGTGLSFYYWSEAETLDRIVTLVSLPMYVVQLVGLFGFVYGRRIGVPALWKVVLAVTILEFAWQWYEHPPVGPDAWFIASLALMSALLLLPMLVALYVYAFRSPALWAHDHRPSPQ